jgi:translation initiation factor IF-2
MRARGANMTDVAVLVVDAAQGVQPQTVESINHSRAAGVPIVVAMNKIDLPDANPPMVLGQLSQQDLTPVAYGGTTEVVETSGRTGQGIDNLIEILDLQSQILELKADPTAPARGIVIEARIDPGLGSVATVLVQDGTLKVGDVVLAGEGYGRVRQLMDSTGKFIQSAGPSTPVLIAGLSGVPNAGDKFFAVNDLDRAKQIAEERKNLARSEMLAGQTRVSLDNLFDTMKEGDIKTINLILKADVAGSVETLQKTVTEYNTAEVQVKIIHAAVGPVNESDVDLASASDAVIIGFHVATDPKAQTLAETRRVEVRTYRVIYEIFDDLKKSLSGMLAPEVREKLHGHCEVRQVFKVSRLGNIAGCFVTDGHIQRGSKIRLTRGGVIVTEDLSIETLKRVKDDVKDVKAGLECGIKLANYDDIKVGDILEAYVREEFQRTL